MKYKKKINIPISELYKNKISLNNFNRKINYYKLIMTIINKNIKWIILKKK